MKVKKRIAPQKLVNPQVVEENDNEEQGSKPLCETLQNLTFAEQQQPDDLTRSK